jgi:hypothetical protein
MNFKERKKQDNKLSSPVLLKVPVTVEYRNNLPVEFNTSSPPDAKKSVDYGGTCSVMAVMVQNLF